MPGLSNIDAKKLLEQHGENTLKESGREPLWKKFLSQFTDFMVLTLIAAALIALIVAYVKQDFTEMIDVYMILGIVILNAIIGFIQEFKSEKAIEALKKMVAPHAKVLRDGEIQQIETKYIVPGDILMLEAGDKVAADAILIESNELRADESALTGESRPVKKQLNGEEPNKTKVFMGTGITNGTAQAKVISTGMNTEFGKITHLTVSTKQDKTPLQKELKNIGIFVGKIALLISAILFIIGIVIQGQSVIDALLFAVAVAVAAVPEGLPAIVTITLALAIQKLAKKRAIIKQLSSVETLGSTTIICSDKTGTLTQNEMTVKSILLGTKDNHEVSGAGYNPKEGKIESKNADTKALAMLISICRECNNAKLHETDGSWKIIGDPTEGALMTFAEKGIQSNQIHIEDYKRIKEYPFDSERKIMSVYGERDGKKTVFVKGAPDNILEKCTHILINGEKQEITSANKEEIKSSYNAFADKALRVLACAYKNAEEIETEDQTENNLVFVGLVGMIDPPRKEVPQAVKMCKEAGIEIIVITGDYGPTAMAIAKEIGIGNDETKLITGTELENMKDEELFNTLKESHSLIFARIKPEHKLRIVETLKKQNEVVAVTGDGVNDAPALKRADIGVSMGISGTEVSKEASNMILTDDSFASIVEAIYQGRSIYENLKKFIWFIISSNIGEVLTIFLAIVLFLPAPLSAILILAVNAGTDILPALALGVEKPEKYIMNQAPRDPKQRILGKRFIARMVYIGTLVGAVVVSVFVWGLSKYEWQWGQFPSNNSTAMIEATTMAFVALVFTQLFNALNARSTKTSLFKLTINPHLIGAIAISILLVIGIVELPIAQHLFDTTHLSLYQWLTITFASSSILFIEEIRKIILPEIFTQNKKYDHSQSEDQPHAHAHQ